MGEKTQFLTFTVLTDFFSKKLQKKISNDPPRTRFFTQNYKKLRFEVLQSQARFPMYKNRRLLHAKIKKTKNEVFDRDFTMNPLQKSLWNHLGKGLNLATIKGHIEQSV